MSLGLKVMFLPPPVVSVFSTGTKGLSSSSPWARSISTKVGPPRERSPKRAEDLALMLIVLILKEALLFDSLTFSARTMTKPCCLRRASSMNRGADIVYASAAIIFGKLIYAWPIFSPYASPSSSSPSSLSTNLNMSI